MMRSHSETGVKEALNKLIPFIVRQAHHERNQYLTVRPEPVEGLNQSFLKSALGVIACCLLMAAAQTARAKTPYKVEGNKVDKATFEGWKIYKRQRCETCHGPTGEGGPAFPNLLNSMKNLSKEQFQQVILEGRKNMPAYNGNKAVIDNMDGLYAYLKGRSDGATPAGDLVEMQ